MNKYTYGAETLPSTCYILFPEYNIKQKHHLGPVSRVPANMSRTEKGLAKRFWLSGVLMRELNLSGTQNPVNSVISTNTIR